MKRQGKKEKASVKPAASVDELQKEVSAFASQLGLAPGVSNGFNDSDFRPEVANKSIAPAGVTYKLTFTIIPMPSHEAPTSCLYGCISPCLSMQEKAGKGIVFAKQMMQMTLSCSNALSPVSMLEHQAGPICRGKPPLTPLMLESGSRVLALDLVSSISEADILLDLSPCILKTAEQRPKDYNKPHFLVLFQIVFPVLYKSY